MKQEYTW